MDPNTCLQRMINAADAGNVEDTLQAIDDLTSWLKSGGFQPTPELYGSAIESVGFLLAQQVVQ